MTRPFAVRTAALFAASWLVVSGRPSYWNKPGERAWLWQLKP